MGHKVSAVDGGNMGGYQGIRMAPAPKEPKSNVSGAYRAGTDHRKDGIAIGW
jgi:gamma-glutamyltranspeptidase / glutathione hydrolase